MKAEEMARLYVQGYAETVSSERPMAEDLAKVLTLAQQDARAAALEEAAKLIEGDARYDNWNVKAQRIRALLEGK